MPKFVQKYSYLCRFTVAYSTWDGYAFYREPGNDGYTVDSVLDSINGSISVNYKHFKSCFSYEDGSWNDCIIEPGSTYVKYECSESNNPNNSSNNDNDNDPEKCQTVYKECPNDENILCKQYSFATIEDDGIPRGYVPQTSFCQDSTGGITEALGEALDFEGGGTLGNCTYGYGDNGLVNKSMPLDDNGEPFDYDYAFCNGKTDEECQRMFRGGWYGGEIYDPRYRPWYTETKRLLKPNWAEPYPFYGTNDTGITLSYPIFSKADGQNKKRLEGVCAVDYKRKYCATLF